MFDESKAVSRVEIGIMVETNDRRIIGEASEWVVGAKNGELSSLIDTIVNEELIQIEDVQNSLEEVNDALAALEEAKNVLTNLVNIGRQAAERVGV